MTMRWFVSGIWLLLTGIGYLASRHYHDADSCETTRYLPAQHRLRAADLECAMPDRATELTGLYLKERMRYRSKVTQPRLSPAPDLTAGPGTSVLAVSLAGREDLARQLDPGSTVTVTDGATATGGLPVIAVSCRDHSDANCMAVIAVPAALQATVHDASKLTVIGTGT
jgi:hypothetical protein